MSLNSVQIYEPDHFGNGWGFYVDLENPHIPIYKQLFVTEKYRRNYYNSYDKIDEELEYYEYEYDKKREDESKQIEDVGIIKTNSSALLFNISSVTLVTAALSYCFLAAL